VMQLATCVVTNGLHAWLQMAYVLPFFFENMSPVMQLAYVCGCKRIMCVVANGLCAWLKMAYG